MGTALSIFKLLLSFANTLAGYLKDQQLLEAGRALADASNLKRALDEVRRADDARERVARDIRAHGPDWMPPDDQFRRD